MGAVQNKDGSWRLCVACDADGADWMPCFASSPREEASGRHRRRRSLDRRNWATGVIAQRLEDLTLELFRLHDLNGDGALAEQELVSLNEMIAQLHSGNDVDTSDVSARYREVFRSKLDPDGRPVAYAAFRAYAREVLEGLDTDPEAQEMIMEQFVAEARSAREVFQLPSMCGSYAASLARGGSFGLDAPPRTASFASRNGGGLLASGHSFSVRNSPSFAESHGLRSSSFPGIGPATNSFVDPSIGCLQIACPSPWTGYSTSHGNARSAAVWVPGSGLQQPCGSSALHYSCTAPMSVGAPQVLVAPLPSTSTSFHH